MFWQIRDGWAWRWRSLRWTWRHSCSRLFSCVRRWCSFRWRRAMVNQQCTRHKSLPSCWFVFAFQTMIFRFWFLVISYSSRIWAFFGIESFRRQKCIDGSVLSRLWSSFQIGLWWYSSEWENQAARSETHIFFLREFKLFTVKDLQAAAAALDQSDHQLKQQKLQQCSETTMSFAEVQRSTLFSTQVTAQPTLSEAISIISWQKMRSLMAIQSQSQKVGRDFRATLTLHSLTRMERRTSSKDQNTGVTTGEFLMENTRRRLTKVSLVCRTISTLQWSGVEMERFTFTKEVNFGDSIHLKDRQ